MAKRLEEGRKKANFQEELDREMAKRLKAEGREREQAREEERARQRTQQAQEAPRASPKPRLRIPGPYLWLAPRLPIPARSTTASALGFPRAPLPTRQLPVP